MWREREEMGARVYHQLGPDEAVSEEMMRRYRRAVLAPRRSPAEELLEKKKWKDMMVRLKEHM
jgi:hypothetical protein